MPAHALRVLLIRARALIITFKVSTNRSIIVSFFTQSNSGHRAATIDLGINNFIALFQMLPAHVGIVIHSHFNILPPSSYFSAGSCPLCLSNHVIISKVASLSPLTMVGFCAGNLTAHCFLISFSRLSHSVLLSFLIFIS